VRPRLRRRSKRGAGRSADHGLTTVIFSNIRADLLQHRHHHVAAWRAEKGRTIWVDSLGSRNPRLRDLRRLGGERAGQSHSGVLPAVEVVKGGAIPIHGSDTVYAFNARRLERRLRSLAVVPESTIAWVYLAHPAVLRLLRRNHWRSVVFDLCDDISDIDGIHPRVLDAEADLLQAADVVFASSEDLVSKARTHRGDGVYYVPNGVDSARFENVKPWSRRIQTLLYIGSVFEWFDEELLAAVASERSDLQFRVVGPIRRPLRRLRRLANVDLAGPVPAATVPAEIEGSDLCVIPFRAGPLIRATDPLKVYEALAAGRPVLATHLPQAGRLAPAVRLEPSSEGWLSAIEDLERGRWCFNPDAIRQHVRLAEDWRRRFDLMDEAVEGALA
jgi:glycosyltransferase involved in cell wall biosynthesis